MAIKVNLDVVMAKRKISSVELSERLGITQAKPFDFENRQGKGNKVFYAGRCLQGAVLSAGRYFGIFGGLKWKTVIWKKYMKEYLKNRRRRVKEKRETRETWCLR